MAVVVGEAVVVAGAPRIQHRRPLAPPSHAPLKRWCLPPPALSTSPAAIDTTTRPCLRRVVVVGGLEEGEEEERPFRMTRLCLGRLS